MEEEKKPKVSKTQQGHVNKYIKNHYDRMSITVPKGTKEKIKEIADSLGISVNALIISALKDKYNDLI